ncbi:hypothetical protein B0H10DRAFT_1941683 [Mycena sp. CBHHK59/15]|nr:hypothetical protein B0H10DRAFT_1941683 [Mycena sp. CBHHK59/15]
MTQLLGGRRKANSYKGRVGGAGREADSLVEGMSAKASSGTQGDDHTCFIVCLGTMQTKTLLRVGLHRRGRGDGKKLRNEVIDTWRFVSREVLGDRKEAGVIDGGGERGGVARGSAGTSREELDCGRWWRWVYLSLSAGIICRSCDYTSVNLRAVMDMVLLRGRRSARRYNNVAGGDQQSSPSSAGGGAHPTQRREKIRPLWWYKSRGPPKTLTCMQNSSYGHVWPEEERGEGDDIYFEVYRQRWG